MTVTPGLYRITTQLRPNAPIGIDPYNLAAIKPVVIAIPGFSPEGTTWRVLEEDGQLYLLLVHTAKTRPEDDKVYAYYSEPGERWAIVYHPEREGYSMLRPDHSYVWYLPNAEDLTQVELRPVDPILQSSGGYYFNFERLGQ